MMLSAGDRLGSYQIEAPIGAGGMGEVYKARDTKLDRDVALKILPDAFVNDPERLARFQREAKVLASLNHPNIAIIYGLEESGDSPALVLEYVEGPTLQDRISRGPIPLDEALPIARQIAEALEAAHEQGIIHRDLKPANVKVKGDGTVKVLDFGLAKALAPDLSDAEAANSPTMAMTAAATKMGVVMGTTAYMAPEQAAGKPANRRSDLWAFGVLLWEMLTGKQLFTGESVSHVLAAVLRADPDWAALPTETPSAVRRLLRRCLERNPKQRLPDAAMGRLEIDEADDLLEAPGAATPAATRPALWQRPFGIVVISLFTLVLGGLAVWHLTRSDSPTLRVTRFPIVIPPGHALPNSEHYLIAISRDGTRLVYVASNQLYLRPLDRAEATLIPDTEGAREPFFSPDGQWIGYWAEGQLKKVSVSGGAPITLCEVANAPAGATWSPDDTILFNSGVAGVVYRLPGTGGEPELVVDLGPGELGHRRPQLLPDGEWVLSSVWPSDQVVIQSMITGERQVLLDDGGGDARYLPSGHLVYVVDGTVFAQAFDPVSRTLVPGAVPLVEGVSQAGNGLAHYAVSDDGTLVYLAGSTGASARTLVWLDRAGQEEALAAPLRRYDVARLSPDGTRVALDDADDEEDIWIWDLTRETLTRLTVAVETDGAPVWTPDGQRVVFTSNRDGIAYNLYWRAADGTGAVERLNESPNTQVPHTISPDGTRLVFLEVSPDTGSDLHVLTLDDERRVEPLLVTEFDEQNAELSPDGRWLAYESNTSGQYEIYVQPFPNVDAGRWQISTTGGTHPLWGPDGREVFYLTDAGVMGVTVETGAGFEAGTPALVVAGSYYRSFRSRYDISPDGQRFLMLKAGGTVDADDPFAGLTQIHVVLNWHQELLARVPVP